MKKVKLTINAEERLDTALAKTLNVSRSVAQKYIKEGRVLVDGVSANAHFMVEPKSKVTMEDAKIPVATPSTKLPKLDIIFEDADVIVVSKPAGLLVHQAPGEQSLTLADALLAHAPQMRQAGKDEHRSGIVHRLDKDASGVIIAAKNEAAFVHLKRQFSERLTEKEYVVLVMGEVKDDNGTINFPIARSTTRARMAARPTSQEGKEAVTHFEVMERYSVGTLLKVKIETGRTHQIRAHMFAIGHPVAGDTLYKRKDIKPVANLHRLFLHAQALTIDLPNGERKTFEAPLPQELVDIISTLKKRP